MLLIVILCICRIAFAMQASPFPFTVSQPSGAEITLFLRGSEFYHQLEDTQGFTVMKSTASSSASEGILGSTEGQQPLYVYATLGADGNLAPTEFVVGVTDPASVGLQRKITPAIAPDNDNSRMLFRRSHAHTREAQSTGAVTNLVVMVRWADSPFQTRTATAAGLPTVQDLTPLFNGATRSVQDVYRQNSYGKLTVTSVFTDWITVNVTEAQAAVGRSGLACCSLQNALVQALVAAENKGLNFASLDQNGDGDIDMITFLHSGYAAEWGGAGFENRIWSHKWFLPTPYVSRAGVAVGAYHISPAMWGVTGTTVGRIGVISHEIGHFLGLPDLYDTDGPGFGTGLGSYSLMANSWGFDGTQNFPPSMDPYCKLMLGWMEPTLITSSGTYTVSASVNTPQVFKITQGFPEGEYLLIENRQPMGYDAVMPRGGLAIYHIDENASYNTQGWPQQAGWPQNGNHYRVALLQADGLYQLESTTSRGDSGDLYSVGGAATVLGPNTVPSTNAYQGGIILDTGITITVLSAPSTAMQFEVSMPGSPLPTSTPPPGAAPTITVTSTQTATATVTATVTSTRTVTPTPTPVPMWLSTIRLSQTAVAGRTNTFTASATVVVRDSVAWLQGVLVTGVFRSRGKVIATRTDSTVDASGNYVLAAGINWTGTDSTLQFCVTKVVRANYVYRPTSNVVAGGCVTVGTTRRI